MRRIIQPPDPAGVINSMRALGYSFETALADIIDNSISAEATQIDIILQASPEPVVAILDNGVGMDEETLVQAMRHGSTDPRTERNPADLGRYGLGLKTASLSQCRRLTVVSLVRGEFAAARWDLDVIEQTRDWALDVLTVDEVPTLPGINELSRAGRGTVVIWEDFDRAAAGVQNELHAIERLVDDARDHLALTFHRYTSDDDAATHVAIRLNNLPLPRGDPFLRDNRRTETLPPETMHLRGHAITVQAYILPHLTHIKDESVRNNLRRSQGFYLYRNRRLICYGTWFKLIRHEELTKLARVSIEIPNAVDDLWGIDIRKATADPPPEIRRRLRELVERIADRSENVFRERKRRLGKEDITCLWDRIAVRNAIRYSINRNHPLLQGLKTTLPPESQRFFDNVLDGIELALPADAIFADMAKSHGVAQADTDRTYDELREIAMLVLRGSPDVQHTLANLPLIEPFSLHREITQQLIKELRNACTEPTTP